MNILLRRHLRHILHSKLSTANETLQLDAGWNTIQNEILVRKTRLYFEVCNGSRGTLASEIAEIARARRTPWFVELEEELGDSNIDKLLTSELRQRNMVISNMRKQDKQQQMTRLANECEPTTRAYR